MVMRLRNRGWGAAAVVVAVTLAPSARAQDFFSALFGGFGGVRQHGPMTPLPYAGGGYSNVPEGEAPQRQRPVYSYSGGSQAYCVRTCDGRYFPITASGNQTKAATLTTGAVVRVPLYLKEGDVIEVETESGRFIKRVNR